MRSVASNLAALGALMKTNLEAKGVTGLSSNMRLTTLANKILDIQAGSSHDTLTFTVNGNVDLPNFSVGNTTGLIVLWGDGTYSMYSSGTLAHTYTDGLTTHTVHIIGEITKVGPHCFENCTGLTSISIPDSVTSFEGSCFWGTGLTSISIPDSVTYMDSLCFGYCTSLTSIVIPDSVTYIGGSCFSNCTSLVDCQLYWSGNAIITYGRLPYNANTVFTIPPGETSNYVSKSYPSANLQERGGTPTSISISSSSTDINVGESITLTGTLLDDNNDGISGASVEIYQNSVLLDTVTTDSNGDYIKTVNSLSAGSYSFKSVYAGDLTYDASESSVVSVTVHDYSLTLTGTAIIQTGDSDTITATLTDDGLAVSGESLSYQVKHGSTVIDSGSSTTDSNGQATISYTGTGVGDIDVIVYKTSMSLQETFVVQDCHFYDTASTDKSSSYVAKPLGTHLISNSISYANNEYTVSSNVDSTAWTGVNPSVSLSTEDNWVFSAKVKSKAFPSIGLGDGVQKHIEMIRYPLNGNWAVYGYISPNSYLVSNKNLSSSSNTYYTHEISLENGVFTFKIYDTNGNLLDSATIQLPSVYENSTVYPVISTFPNANDQRSITFKDVKIKAL